MNKLIILFVCTSILTPGFVLKAQVQERIIFKGSVGKDYYDPSWGFATPPSFLGLQSEKLPVDTVHHYAGTNSLNLHWISKTGGEWGVAVASAGWNPFDVMLKDSLSFMVYSETAMRGSDLPLIYFEDIHNWKTGKISLSTIVSDIPKGQWVKVKIPSQAIHRIAEGADLSRIKTVFFGQDAADGVEHTLYVDDLKCFGGAWLAKYHFIVVLGSSTTVGFGADHIDSTWVNRFRHYAARMDSTYQVINLAVARYSTYRVMPSGFRPPLERASSDLGKNISTAMDYHPKAIIINLPSDDVAYGYSTAEQLNNYDTLFAFAKEQKVPLWITSAQPRNFRSSDMRRQLVAIRDSVLHRYSGGHGIDFWTGIADSIGGIRPEYDSGDGIHLNNAGHGILCQRVISAKVLEALLK